MELSEQKKSFEEQIAELKTQVQKLSVEVEEQTEIAESRLFFKSRADQAIKLDDDLAAARRSIQQHEETILKLEDTIEDLHREADQTQDVMQFLEEERDIAKDAEARASEAQERSRRELERVITRMENMSKGDTVGELVKEVRRMTLLIEAKDTEVDKMGALLYQSDQNNKKLLAKSQIADDYHAIQREANKLQSKVKKLTDEKNRAQMESIRVEGYYQDTLRRCKDLETDVNEALKKRNTAEQELGFFKLHSTPNDQVQELRAMLQAARKELVAAERDVESIFKNIEAESVVMVTQEHGEDAMGTSSAGASVRPGASAEVIAVYASRIELLEKELAEESKKGRELIVVRHIHEAELTRLKHQLQTQQQLSESLQEKIDGLELRMFGGTHRTKERNGDKHQGRPQLPLQPQSFNKKSLNVPHMGVEKPCVLCGMSRRAETEQSIEPAAPSTKQRLYEMQTRLYKMQALLAHFAKVAHSARVEHNHSVGAGLRIGPRTMQVHNPTPPTGTFWGQRRPRLEREGSQTERPLRSPNKQRKLSYSGIPSSRPFVEQHLAEPGESTAKSAIPTWLSEARGQDSSEAYNKEKQEFSSEENTNSTRGNVVAGSKAPMPGDRSTKPSNMAKGAGGAAGKSSTIRGFQGITATAPSSARRLAKAPLVGSSGILELNTDSNAFLTSGVSIPKQV